MTYREADQACEEIAELFRRRVVGGGRHNKSDGWWLAAVDHVKIVQARIAECRERSGRDGTDELLPAYRPPDQPR